MYEHSESTFVFAVVVVVVVILESYIDYLQSSQNV